MTRRPRPRARAVLAGALAGAAVAAAALAVPTSAAQGETTAPDDFRPQLVTVDTPTRAARTRLTKLGLDLTEHAGRDYVEVVLHSPADAAALRASGLEHEVRIADLLRREAENNAANARYSANVARSPLPSGNTSYRTLKDYNADMLELAQQKRWLVRKFKLKRPSLDGRRVYGVEIGAGVGRVADGKPTFVLMGAHHAREWPSAELAMEFATDLVKNYGRQRRITKLLNRARVIVVPVVNVDGFHLSRTDGGLVDLRDLNAEDPLDGTTSVLATPGQAYKRKNCRVVDGRDTPDGTCRATLASPGGFGLGVDLNRNYGGFWGGPGASGPEPDGEAVEAGIADPTYRGAKPFSEPETKNIRDLVRNRQVTMLISNHTFSNLILRPNGVNPATVAPDGIPVGDAPDEKGLKGLGARMAAQNGYQNIHGWQLYDTTGTTEDWSYNATGGYGYTFEIGANEFHPPFPEVVDEYRGAGAYAGKGNREAYLIALEHAVDMRYHGRLVGRTRPGTLLKLSKTFRTPTWEGSFRDRVQSFYQVRGNGRVSWTVNPSTRPVVRPRSYEKVLGGAYRDRTYTGSVAPLGTKDHEFTVPSRADLLKVDLDWSTPDDLDLEVYRKKADGSLEEAGTSGNLPGEKEAVQIPDAAAGTYVLRVVNYASVAPEYTLDAGLYESVTRTTAGRQERYTLTCIRGGKVRMQTKVLVHRGQVRRLPLGRCR